MNKPDVLQTWTIFRHPRDYPNSYVVRRFDIVPGSREPVPSMYPHAIGPTLEAVRQTIPPGLMRFDRHPMDEPQIVEIWM